MSNTVTNIADGLPSESLELTYETDGSDVAALASSGSQTSEGESSGPINRMSDSESDGEDSRMQRVPSESCSGREQQARNAGAEPRRHGLPWGGRWTYAWRQQRPALRPGNFGAKLDAKELVGNNRHSSLARSFRRMDWCRSATPDDERDEGRMIERDAAAAVVRAAEARFAGWPGAGSLLPPPGLNLASDGPTCPVGVRGRVFLANSSVLRRCLDTEVFASNHVLDVGVVEPGWVALIHSLDQGVSYGVYQVVQVGTNLDPGFGPGFPNQVRLRTLRTFRPLPDELLMLVHERKRNSQTRAELPFFVRDMQPAQVQALWKLMEYWNQH